MLVSWVLLITALRIKPYEESYELKIKQLALSLQGLDTSFPSTRSSKRDLSNLPTWSSFPRWFWNKHSHVNSVVKTAHESKRCNIPWTVGNPDISLTRRQSPISGEAPHGVPTWGCSERFRKLISLIFLGPGHQDPKLTRKHQVATDKAKDPLFPWDAFERLWGDLRPLWSLFGS